ncbi:methylecgonone reductase-like isoform X2 [Rhodamnia argentea]|uniref:Methylecgonone reductase-like isoform X2 n=1 Tax=Rhodamnia argentea TaxID=178133 RepID=A0A8B8Q235_9MYRT|nr:methylecgonone reductase-like isoform X2 [Rhodamnia argentea]XP_048132189.1 methylecgonone reductase-like isoform X2 [Rhodamnia argentea]XP_048132193.1 methylecgonone reductase-like isoform X2 [Rhodamnia argentea]
MHDVVVPEVVLSSGARMPLISMGCAASPRPPTDVLTSILLEAIEVGYRHFDTASLYGTEEAVGRAVAEALERGLVESRDQIFITTKLWCTDAHPDLVLPALKKSLQRLGLEYVDLYLIHWPVRLKEGTEGFDFKGKILPFDAKGTWEAMEECSKLGLAKSIGVSNFGTKKLSQLLSHATIPPAVNQVEMNAAWRQEKLRGYCREKGIQVSAWSPLGANGAAWGSLAVVDSPVLKEIAIAKGKSVAQVALRWVYEQGACVIAKSFNKERMKENLQILEWGLSQEDSDKIKLQIPQRRGCPSDMFISEEGPYKSLDELWDGDA